MALAPISLSDATALLVWGAWYEITPGTLSFVQQATMIDENGAEVPLPEPWVQFAEPASTPTNPGGTVQPRGFPWRAVDGVALAEPAQPDPGQGS